jgi:NDP-sugar pyrophosphorylase family protein
MGIYAMNRKILSLVEKGRRFDFPDFVLKANREGLKVRCYLGAMDKIWLDIGRPEDYEEAIRIFKESRAEFLP